MRNNSSRNSSNGGSSRRGPRREQKKNMDYEARVTRNGVSANHLLNFSMPERERQVHHHQKKTKSSTPRTQSEYLHANYRFVIAPLDRDTIVPTWDLEALTEWSSVEQVLLWYDVGSPQTCPICMDTFRAPKITKCGHVFWYVEFSMSDRQFQYANFFDMYVAGRVFYGICQCRRNTGVAVPCALSLFKRDIYAVYSSNNCKSLPT